MFIPAYFRAPIGGVQAHLSALVAGAQQGGFHCTVMCPSGGIADSLEDIGASVLAVDFNDLDGCVALALESGPFDLVHAHPFAARIVGRSVANELQVPLILTCHGMNSDGLATYAEDVMAVIAVSTGVRDFLVAEGVPTGNIVVIPNGVDPGTFRPAAVPPSAHRVVVVSRLDADKSLLIRLLREIWMSTGHESENVDWIVVGDGPERRALQEWVGDQPVGARVRFVGWCTGHELAAIHHSATIALASGRSALEALACSVSVIAVGSRAYVGRITPSTIVGGEQVSFGDSTPTKQPDPPVEAALADLVALLAKPPRPATWASEYVHRFHGQGRVDDATNGLYRLALALDTDAAPTIAFS